MVYTIVKTLENLPDCGNFNYPVLQMEKEYATYRIFLV
jgi:hypothetical protein